MIVVEGRRRDLLRVKDITGLELKADVHLAEPTAKTRRRRQSSRAC